MISKLSSGIVKVLIRQSVVDKENEDLYNYGFFILLSQILYFIIALIIGILLNAVLHSIIFYIAFSFIRRYAGGYHASTEIRCEISTAFSIIVCISVIKLSQFFDFNIILLIISAISAICIFVLCPLDTPEKPLSENEYKYFRKISWLILFIIINLIIISYVLSWKFSFAPCCMSLILESILISAGKMKKLINTNHNKEKI